MSRVDVFRISKKLMLCLALVGASFLVDPVAVKASDGCEEYNGNLWTCMQFVEADTAECEYSCSQQYTFEYPELLLPCYEGCWSAEWSRMDWCYDHCPYLY